MAKKEESIAFQRLSVKAVMMGAKNGVVLEDALASRTLFLSEGESNANFKVQKIGPQSVVLVMDGREMVLPNPSRAEGL